MAMMPRPTAPIAGPGGLPTREWLDYLRSLAGAGDLSGIERAIAELERQVTELQQSGSAGEVLGIGAVQNIGSLADGLVRLNLRELEDAGGGELLKILRDGYGRVAGTSAATTDDLPEGVINRYSGRVDVSDPTFASGTLTLDFQGRSRYVGHHLLTASVSELAFANLPGAGSYAEYELHLTQDSAGGHTVAIPASHRALGGSDTVVATAPSAATVLTAASVNNGATWRYAMQESA